MSDSDNFFIIVFVVIFVTGIFLIGYMLGGLKGHNDATEQSRNTFIMYCTEKGDTYKKCDALFYGKEYKSE